MSCTYISSTPPTLEIRVISIRGAHRDAIPWKTTSPPRADSLLSMLRSASVDDDYFERRALRATCIQKTPLDNFYPQASEIVPGLFVCDMYTATSPAMIRGLGITHVASVVKHHCPRFPKGMHHICIPIEDTREAQLLEYLDFTIDWIIRALNGHGQVMVHCIWGMSRSASIAIAYLMMAKHMSLEDALKLAVSRRQVVRPNSGFMKQLKFYEHVLKARERRRIDIHKKLERMSLSDETNGIARSV